MRYLTAVLAVAFTACLCATASASVLNPPGTTSHRAGVTQRDLRNLDNRAAVHANVPRQDFRNPDNRVAPGASGNNATVASGDAATASKPSIAATSPVDGGGLSAFVIVLISVGGAVALAGVAVVTTRVVHHHHPMA
ncbi:MAG: hypothetical protein QOK21_4454 [Solirubrobacteraceae bacterium]|jgi:hypothetical protein|nr:hypothetical protein [Solirubrobacteraceae bacterium]